MDPFDEKRLTDEVPVVPLDPSAVAERRPYLIVLTGAGAGRLIPLEQTTTVGQHGEADVALEDSSLGAVHCRVEVDPNRDAFLVDLGSAAGTFVNQAPVSGPVPLRDGDRIRLGDTLVLKFALQDDLEAGFRQDLFDAALRDPLTELFNKRYLLERGEQEFTYAKRHGTDLSLLLLDLDHFKQINDRFGHQAGDHVLRLIGLQLQALTRAEDVVGRFGGEEFAVIAHGLAPGRALLLAERIRHLVERSPYRWQREPVAVTLSCGIAGLPDPSVGSPRELMTLADAALYRAKGDGRNLTRVHHQEQAG
jgi:diguanylate cyclase (GGDEF)-like protein